MRRLFMPALAVLSLVLLASCGGGGSNPSGIVCTRPNVPVLQEPEAGAELTVCPVNFCWGASLSATAYEFQLFGNTDCDGTPIATRESGDDCVPFSPGEGPGSWRVRAVNDTPPCVVPEYSDWSACRDFTSACEPPCEFPAPVINNPCSNTVASQNVVFTWNTLDNAEGYKMRLHLGSGCQGNEDNWEEHDTTKARYQKKFLISGAMYSWEVQAWGHCPADPLVIVYSEWSDCCNFQAFP